MGNRYILTPDGELYHWGIKGMKWGQRRWQNKDGSLTPAGKKRYAKEEMSLKERERYIKGREKAAVRQAKLDAKKAELDAREKALDGGGKRTRIGDPGSQGTANTRVKGDSFAKKFIDEAVKPAAIAAGKDFIEKALKKASADILKDKVDPKSLAGIEAANKKLRAQIENDLLKSGIDPNIKSENLDKWVKFNEERKAKKSGKSDKSEPKDASASNETPKTDNSPKNDRSKDPKVTVEGKGASQKTNNAERKKSEPTIIDVEPDDSGTYSAVGKEYLDLVFYDPYRRGGG